MLRPPRISPLSPSTPLPRSPGAPQAPPPQPRGPQASEAAEDGPEDHTRLGAGKAAEEERRGERAEDDGAADPDGQAEVIDGVGGDVEPVRHERTVSVASVAKRLSSVAARPARALP